MFRLAPVRFSPLAVMLCFVAMGRFDTAQAQVLTVSNSSLSFTAAQGANPSPNSQTIDVGSTGANIVYSISLSTHRVLAVSGRFPKRIPGGSTSGTALLIRSRSQVNSATLDERLLQRGSHHADSNTGSPALPPTVTISVSLTVTGTRDHHVD